MTRQNRPPAGAGAARSRSPRRAPPPWLPALLLLAPLPTAGTGGAHGQGGADAGNALVFSPAIFYRTLDSQNGTDETLLITDLNLGFKLSALYLGAMLGRESNDPAGSRQKQYGPSIGLIAAGYDFIATYHVFAEREQDGRTLKDGTGVQIDFGRKFMLSPTFGLGPRLSFKRFRFRKESVAGVETEIPGGETVKEFVPTFAAIFFF